MDFIRQNLHFLLSVRRRAGTQARFAAEDGRCLHFLTFNAEKRTVRDPHDTPLLLLRLLHAGGKFPDGERSVQIL